MVGKAHPPELRFWANVKQGEGCWLWQGSVNHKGYALFFDGTRNVRAQRRMWELQNGPIPSGLQVCHRCDVRACVNPAHLFLGTNADNMADKMAKGRHRTSLGSRNGAAKLTETDVIEIRALRAAGHFNTEIARRFQISNGAVGRIVRGLVWKWVKG